MRLLYAICSVLLAPALALCQSADSPKTATPDKESATVAGQVVRADTGEPLKKAQVSLQGRAGDAWSAFRLTDDQGRFSFENVPPNSYGLHVSRNGFVDAEYGQRKLGAPGAVLAVSGGQRMADLVFKMIHAASISGHVYDEDLEPLSHAEVLVYLASRQSGKEELNGYEQISTNDLGEFRVFDLAPGRYFLVANYRLQQHGGLSFVEARKNYNPGYLPTYYPNTTDSSKASPITVSAGDDVRSVDFMLRPGRLATVSGRVTGTVPDADHSGGGVVYLYPKGTGLGGATHDLYCFLQKDGRFSIADVLPGSYYIETDWSQRDSKQRFRTRREIDVAQVDVNNLTITVAPGLTVTGRVLWDGSPSTKDQQVVVCLYPTEEHSLNPEPQTIRPDGSFTFEDVSAGSYRLAIKDVGLNNTTFVKSARYGSVTIGDAGFTIQAGSDAILELTVSSRAPRVSGTVLTADSLPLPGAQVILIPDPPRRSIKHYYKTASTDQNGRFSLECIAPGDYKLFSWDSLEGNEWSDAEWHDAAWLKPFEAKGESIHLEESDKKSVNLTLIETKPDSPAAN